MRTLKRAGMNADEIDIVSTHATGTSAGDIQEGLAVNAVFGESDNTWINNTKGYIGHAMGGAGALELAGNMMSFEDGLVHPCMNVDSIDPECAVNNLAVGDTVEKSEVNAILNNSFGMLGINSALIIKKFIG